MIKDPSFFLAKVFNMTWNKTSRAFFRESLSQIKRRVIRVRNRLKLVTKSGNVRVAQPLTWTALLSCAKPQKDILFRLGIWIHDSHAWIWGSHRLSRASKLLFSFWESSWSHDRGLKMKVKFIWWSSFNLRIRSGVFKQRYETAFRFTPNRQFLTACHNSSSCLDPSFFSSRKLYGKFCRKLLSKKFSSSSGSFFGREILERTWRGGQDIDAESSEAMSRLAGQIALHKCYLCLVFQKLTSDIYPSNTSTTYTCLQIITPKICR